MHPSNVFHRSFLCIDFFYEAFNKIKDQHIGAITNQAHPEGPRLITLTSYHSPLRTSTPYRFKRPRRRRRRRFLIKGDIVSPSAQRTILRIIP